VKLAEQPGFLQLSVAGTGVGIAEKEKSEILSILDRNQSVSSQSSQSPGMALYITRSLVELNRGLIWFDSQPDLGSVFHVTLPIAY
jgi:signal transduction histidine kinase